MAIQTLTASQTRHYPNDKHPTEVDPSDFPDVYPSMCSGDCLSPIYKDGDCLVFSKLEEPQAGDFVGFWLHPDAVDADELPRRVKRLHMNLMPGTTLPWIPRPGDEAEPIIILEQLNPPKLLKVRASRIVAMHKVVGTAELNGDGTATPRRQQ